MGGRAGIRGGHRSEQGPTKPFELRLDETVISRKRPIHNPTRIYRPRPRSGSFPGFTASYSSRSSATPLSSLLSLVLSAGIPRPLSIRDGNLGETRYANAPNVSIYRQLIRLGNHPHPAGKWVRGFMGDG